MPKIDPEIKTVEKWFNELPVHKNIGGLPARGSIAAALIVAEHLKTNYCLDLNAHLAAGKAQIRGLTASAIQKILARYGEKRIFLSEGGRTNRGGPGDVQKLLDELKTLNLEKDSDEIRNSKLDSIQNWLSLKVGEYFSRKRLEIIFDPQHTTWSAIHNLLDQAAQTGKAGPVAQYLVGAKLQLRFPDLQISNDGYSAADVQTGRLGDFEIGNTTFHVTIAPGPGIYEKCKSNLHEGSRVFLLVPNDCVIGARQNAELIAPDRIAVESLESFIANNIEELSLFSKESLIGGFQRLLETYNSRVDKVELDKSMMIEIPRTLQ